MEQFTINYVDAKGLQHSRVFDSLKSLTQFKRRLQSPGKVTGQFVRNGVEWLQFVVIGTTLFTGEVLLTAARNIELLDAKPLEATQLELPIKDAKESQKKKVVKKGAKKSVSIRKTGKARVTHSKKIDTKKRKSVIIAGKKQ